MKGPRNFPPLGISLAFWLCCCVCLMLAPRGAAAQDIPPLPVPAPPIAQPEQNETTPLPLPPFPARAQSIVFAFDQEFPPFSFERDGEPTGFDIELFRACLENKDIRVTMRPMRWERIQLELSSGQVHVTSGMAKTPQRELLYNFAEQPTTRLEVRLYTRNPNRVPNVEQLRGKNVSVERGTIYQRLLESFGGLSVRGFETQREALQALASGEMDAFGGADKTADYFIRKLPLPGISPIGGPIAVMPIYFATTKDKPELKSLLDTGFRTVLESGRYAQLYRKWFIPPLSDGEITGLVASAKAARIFAYTPYSKQPHGAAVQGVSGRIYTAGNVEHAEPTLGTSASHAAVLKAISEGETDIRALAEVDTSGRVVTPTGKIVDLLMEYGLETQAVTEPEAGRYVPRAVMELLPFNRPRTPGRDTPDIPWLERGEEQP